MCTLGNTCMRIGLAGNETLAASWLLQVAKAVTLGDLPPSAMKPNALLGENPAAWAGPARAIGPCKLCSVE